MAAIVEQVIAEFPVISDPDDVEPLGSANGFSGAEFWRITVGDAVYCLRRWPREHPSEQRLRWIHAVLQHVRGRGIDYTPIPLPNRQRLSYVEKAGWFWEVTNWLRGEASFHASPTPQKLQNALGALAQWHVIAADFDSGTYFDSERCGPPAPAPGMLTRHQRCTELCNGGIDRLSAAVERHTLDQHSGGQAATIAKQLIRQFRHRAPPAISILATACQLKVNRQPCIRDIWHDHVLFEQDRVTGIVDFGAMRPATVAGDVARLLGSLVYDDQDMWAIGIRAYDRVRTLTDDERQLIPAWDLANSLLSGLQWVEWLFVDGRRVANMTAVESRMNEFLGRIVSRDLPN